MRVERKMKYFCKERILVEAVFGQISRQYLLRRVRTALFENYVPFLP